MRLNHSELTVLTLLSPGSRTVVSYPGEPDHFFEKVLGWLVGVGTYWVSTGDKSIMNLWDLGNIACLYHVTQQIMNAQVIRMSGL